MQTTPRNGRTKAAQTAARAAATTSPKSAPATPAGRVFASPTGAPLPAAGAAARRPSTTAPAGPSADANGGPEGDAPASNWHPYKDGRVVAVYPYHDANGAALYERVRLAPPDGLDDPRPKKAIRPRHFAPGDPKAGPDGYRWGQGGHPSTLYRLPELSRAAEHGLPVFVVEGEKDVETLRAWGLVATFKAAHWTADDAAHLRSTSAVVVPDNDDAGRARARQAAEALHAAGVVVQWLDLPGLPPKGDVTDWAALDGGANDRAALEALAVAAPRFADVLAAEKERAARKPSRSEWLVEHAQAQAEFFHTAKGEAFVRFAYRGVRRTALCTSQDFADWLQAAHLDAHGRPALSEDVAQARATVSALARLRGTRAETFVRVAGHDGRVYVDLGRDDWTAAEVDAAGWRIVEAAAVPVAFRRPPGMLPLPVPVKPPEGTAAALGKLRRYVRASTDGDLALLLAWLVFAYSPEGPFPHLSIVGEQDTGKSFATELVRSVVDPHELKSRATPKGERDLMIAAKNSYLLAFDNLSGVQPWFSDALCRISTGAGFATRRLHTDGEEELVRVQRPFLTNGIDDVATRPDLASRTIALRLDPIPPGPRPGPDELLAAFDDDHPAILGGVLDGVAHALALASLRRKADVERSRLVRFETWAEAAETVFPVPPGTFAEAFRACRAEAVEDVAQNDPAVSLLRSMLAHAPGRTWSGTAGDLCDALARHAGGEKPPRDLPVTPMAMSARLRRVAPVLRGIGIEHDRDRAGKGTRVLLFSLK